ncbi:hypothetical protein DFAR_1340037 [Desulfarculales bacterium]
MQICVELEGDTASFPRAVLPSSSENRFWRPPRTPKKSVLIIEEASLLKL